VLTGNIRNRKSSPRNERKTLYFKFIHVPQYIYIKLSNKLLDLIKFSYKFYKSNMMVSLLTQNKPDICDMACYVIWSMYVVEICFITNS